MKTTYNSTKSCLSFLLTGILFFNCSLVFAQEDSEEVYDLSPFRISEEEDLGYRATNTVSGTRLNTSIKDLPMPIEVVTEEFIDDIEAVDLKEVLAFSSGITTDEFLQPSGPGNFDFSPSRVVNREDNSTVVNIRGFTTRNAASLGLPFGYSIMTLRLSDRIRIR